MRRLIGVICFLLGTLRGLDAAIALDNVQTLSNAVGDTSATTHTYTGFTVAANSNKLMVVVVGYGNNAPGTTTVAFDGDALTENTGASISAGGQSTTKIWYIKDATLNVATGDVVITNSNASRIHVDIYSLYNVDQATTFRDQDEATFNSGTTSTLTLDTVSGDWFIDGLFVRQSASDPGALVPTDGTETTETFLSSVYRGSSRYKTASSTSEAGTWNWTACSGGSAGWTHVAVTIIPATSVFPNWYYRMMREQ